MVIFQLSVPRCIKHHFKVFCRTSCVQLSAAHSDVSTDWHGTLPIKILSKVNHFLSFPVLDLVIVDMRVVAFMFPTEDYLLLVIPAITFDYAKGSSLMIGISLFPINGL
jgi:hypothetical protein